MAFTYPIPQTDRFVIIIRATNEIVKRNVKWLRLDGLPIENFPTDKAILKLNRQDRPAYDENTQKLVQVENITLDPTQPDGYWTGEFDLAWDIVPLTQAEIDAIQERQMAKAMYQDLKNSVGTGEQRLRRCELVCAYLLKEVIGGQ
jgi:hypothetical protein